MKVTSEDVQQLSKEVFDDVIQDFETEIAEFRPKLNNAINNNELLIMMITEMSECLRRHSERFSTELVTKTVERLQRP